MEKELEDLKNLSPEERVKELREIERRRKQEIEDAHKLLEDSIDELKNQLPNEEKSVTKTISQPLEQTVEEEAPEIPIDNMQLMEDRAAYVTQLSQKPLGDLQDQRQYLSTQLESGDISSGYKQEKALGNAYALMEAAEAKLEYFSGKANQVGAGYLQKIQAEVNASAGLIESLKRDYER